MTPMNRPELEQEAQAWLAQLGLEALEVAAVDRFESAPEAEKGLGEATRPGLVSAFESAAALVVRTSDALNRLGIDVYETLPDRYVIFGQEDFRPPAPGASPGLIVEPRRIGVDTRELVGRRIVELPAQTLVLGVGPKRELEVILAQPRRERVPVVDAPLEAWTEFLNDPWLVDAVAECRARGGGLAGLIGAGLIYRHRLRSTEDVRKHMAALLQGIDRDVELDWARELDANARETFDREAASRAERLHEELATAIEGPDPADGDWVWWLTRLLHEREELEGARLLLRAAGSAARLERALRLVDAEAKIWIRALPVPSELAHDVWVQRVARLDHDAWWAYPAKLGDAPRA